MGKSFIYSSRQPADEHYINITQQNDDDDDSEVVVVVIDVIGECNNIIKSETLLLMGYFQFDSF